MVDVLARREDPRSRSEASRSWRDSRRKRRRLAPTRSGERNHGSSTKMGCTAAAPSHARTSAGLSCTRSPFRNQRTERADVAVAIASRSSVTAVVAAADGGEEEEKEEGGVNDRRVRSLPVLNRGCRREARGTANLTEATARSDEEDDAIVNDVTFAIHSKNNEATRSPIAFKKSGRECVAHSVAGGVYKRSLRANRVCYQSKTLSSLRFDTCLCVRFEGMCKELG